MEVFIENTNEDCSVIRKIEGIAINPPVPNFPIGSRFEVISKISEGNLTPGGNFCLTFKNEQARETFAEGIEVSILSIPSDMPDEFRYQIEVLEHSCNCP